VQRIDAAERRITGLAALRAVIVEITLPFLTRRAAATMSSGEV
jgi:hypothetical protein